MVLFLTGRPCPPGEPLLAGVETDSRLGMELAGMANGDGRNTAPRKIKKESNFRKADWLTAKPGRGEPECSPGPCSVMCVHLAVYRKQG